MAIVFISPKKRQKIVVSSIIGSVLLILIVIAFWVFLAKPRSISPAAVFHAPKIEINFEILDSEKIKNLQVFEGVKKEFTYQGEKGDGTQQTGKVLAASIKEAEEIVKKLNLSKIVIKEPEIGRENPFAPYEQPVIKPKK